MTKTIPLEKSLTNTFCQYYSSISSRVDADDNIIEICGCSSEYMLVIYQCGEDITVMTNDSHFHLYGEKEAIKFLKEIFTRRRKVFCALRDGITIGGGSVIGSFSKGVQESKKYFPTADTITLKTWNGKILNCEQDPIDQIAPDRKQVTIEEFEEYIEKGIQKMCDETMREHYEKTTKNEQQKP